LIFLVILVRDEAPSSIHRLKVHITKMSMLWQKNLTPKLFNDIFDDINNIVFWAGQLSLCRHIHKLWSIINMEPSACTDKKTGV